MMNIPATNTSFNATVDALNLRKTVANNDSTNKTAAGQAGIANAASMVTMNAHAVNDQSPIIT